MTEYEGGCVERVNHFLKVFAFAKTIAEGEDVDDETKEILEAAAITHDIGIRVCFEKYGNCNGPHQEVEGPPIALEISAEAGNFVPLILLDIPQHRKSQNRIFFAVSPVFSPTNF